MKIPNPVSEPAVMRVGHWSWLIIMTGGAVLIIDNAAGNPPGGPLSWLTSLALIGWMWSLFCDFRVHSRKLCEQCARETPLDPQAAVNRWRLVLRLAHTSTPKILLALVVTWFIGGQFIRHWTWPEYTASSLIMAAIVAWVFIGRQHGRLQAWCPWCHWEDDGDEEVSPDVPDPQLSK